MGRVSYLVGRSVDARQSLLAGKMASHGQASVLHLVPTRGRVMELEADDGFWLRRRVDTLTGIIYRIFEENVRFERFKDYRSIDDTVRSLLVEKILKQRGAQPDGLPYFSRLLSDRNQEIDFPGIYRTISGFFSQLVRNNIQDRFVQELEGRIIRLDQRAPGTGEERYALESDLTWLFGDYEEIKREIRGYDEDDLISGVRSFLKDGGIPHVLTDMEVIVFDGFIHLSRVEEDILFHLFNHVDEVWWLLDYDSLTEDPINGFKRSSGRDAWWHWEDKGHIGDAHEGRHEAYRIFVPLVSLMERLEDAGVDTQVERADEAPFPNPVAGGIYFHGLMDEIPADSLKIRSFANRVDEIRAIAGEIKRIIHEDSMDASQDLGKMRVIFPDLNDYSSIISEIFSEYGLPVSLTKGLPLSSHPVSNIFLCIFDVSLNHFNREDIFRLFSSGLIQVRHSHGLNRDDDRFKWLKERYLLTGDDFFEIKKFFEENPGEQVLYDLDISIFDGVARRCGLNNLGDDLSGLGERGILWVREFYQDRCRDARGGMEKDKLRLEYYGFLIQADLLEQRLRSFQALANQTSPQGILERFFRILEMLGFPENIVDVLDRPSDLNPNMIREMVKRDVKSYSILRDLVQTSAGELRIAGELFQIREGRDLLSRFSSIFRHRLNSAYLLDESNPNVIRVSQWLETRGRSFDYIFSGGLTADRFPLREDMNFILPDSPNRMFRIPDLIDQSRHLFSHLLRNYRKRLYVSYPRYTEEKEVQPSPMLADIESMIDSRISPETGSGTLEEIFRWEDNPYLSSEGEMLNATISKGGASEKKGDKFFPLEQVILRDESPVEEIVRGINALESRRASDGFFEYDGLIRGSARFGEFLNGRDNIFSPSQLETLANCPMRYMFERIYGLEVMEELGSEVSPMDMGEHLHAVLRIFFKGLRDEAKNVYDLGLAQAFSLAGEVAEAYLKKHSLLNRMEFFEPQKRGFLEGLDQDMTGPSQDSEEREGVFARLLRFEEREFRDRIPEGLEYGFGHKEDSPVRLGKTGIRGYIDRFDRNKENRDKVYIYDYKSGKIPLSNMVKKGLSFQLPAYMRALRSGRKSAAFYALNRDVLLKESPLKQTIVDHGDGVKGLDITGVRLTDDFADELMEILENGRFHHSADEMNCHYCEFRYACHKDTRRMNHLLDSGADHQVYSGRKNFERWKKVDAFQKEWKTASQSMQKAFNLKTESGRRGHFEAVVRFRKKIEDDRDSLPFHGDYIDELLHEIGDFEKRYLTL
ncbi:MAG: exodeoxyribonuclease V subunit gamma [Deltaproteobacteria bacterium]|nr:exodeoxyribonuclease V subunit gamma [Deltaproteobacteria bacterium]